MQARINGYRKVATNYQFNIIQNLEFIKEIDDFEVYIIKNFPKTLVLKKINEELFGSFEHEDVDQNRSTIVDNEIKTLIKVFFK